MSRPVAGVRDKSLIITLPGSPKGAKENFQAVIKLLPHACLQAAGANSRAMHAGGVKKLEKEAGISSTGEHHHHHHHHHHHDYSHGHGPVPKAHTQPSERPQSNDPNAAPNRRHRESPYPMLSVDEALEKISENTPSPIIVEAPVNTSLVGSVVAEDVYAAEAVPAFRASIVDGYAVIAPESPTSGPSTKGVFPVASITHANAGGILSALEPGTIARITTGAPLPPNANAVVMVEDTALASSTPDGTEEATIEILTGDIKPQENVREPGSDIALGSQILRRGDLITSVGGEIGLLAATGTKTVKVFKKPCIGVLSTGDELVEHDAPVTLYGGQIRDSNRPSLLSCLASWGFPTVDLGIARDTADDLEQTLRDAMRGVNKNSSSISTPADVIVTTGGVSMGELDLLKPTIERSLGGTIYFGRVSMKPGKPTTFATIPFKQSSDPQTQSGQNTTNLIFSLPGNPASALVTLNLFVLPSLHKLSGISTGISPNSSVPMRQAGLGLPLVSVLLSHAFSLDPKRTEYHRAIVRVSRADARLYASSTGGQRSSRVGSLASANALVVLQPGSGKIEKGSLVQALMLGVVVAEE